NRLRQWIHNRFYLFAGNLLGIDYLLGDQVFLGVDGFGFGCQFNHDRGGWALISGWRRFLAEKNSRSSYVCSEHYYARNRPEREFADPRSPAGLGQAWVHCSSPTG